MATPAFHIGSIPVYGRRILAPMDGFSDLPFRALCRRFGSAMSYTSFVNAAAILSGSAAARAALAFDDQERPVAAQIFDDDETRLLGAARRLLELSPDIVDVNMGCSSRCVAGRGAGAGLLRDPRKIGRILAALSAALPIPVTAKIRLGWDDDTRNYLEVARAIEDNGGRLIAVHGRTKVQAYTGAADWAPIGEIKAAVRIPVLGNGDIASAQDAERLMQRTGCDGVMIGRAAIGNPWIFLAGDATPEPRQVVPIVLEHLEHMVTCYGAVRAVVLFRKHLSRYLDRLALPEAERRPFLTTSDASDLRARL
ncbi:MAG TPA: tRNA-dihydrouridine synthase family protein, partial [Anaerolineales bacterium]|nr:tRNA-dihydrouridine synthase family protein [Anaerolineales bacterium]